MSKPDGFEQNHLSVSEKLLSSLTTEEVSFAKNLFIQFSGLYGPDMSISPSDISDRIIKDPSFMRLLESMTEEKRKDFFHTVWTAFADPTTANTKAEDSYVLEQIVYAVELALQSKRNIS